MLERTIKAFFALSVIMAVFAFGYMVGRTVEVYTNPPNVVQVGNPVPMPQVDVNPPKHI